jgi:thiamine kinase-like enzyme
MANEPEETMEKWKDLALSLLEQNKKFAEELQEWMKLAKRLSEENKQLTRELQPKHMREKLQ